MKKLILALLFFVSIYCNAQTTAPGGVGDGSNISFWLDASQLGLSNNDAVISWTDQSSNNNDATQATSANQPIYKTSQVNGLAAIDFDGSNDFLRFDSPILDSAITLFMVYNSNTTSYTSLLAINKHHYSNRSNTFRSESGSSPVTISKPSNSYSIVTVADQASSSSGTVTLSNGSNTTSSTRGSLFSIDSNQIGALYNSSSQSFFFNGQYAEILAYGERLNNAKRNIIAQYLGIKYNLTSIKSIYSFSANYDSEFVAIGRESGTGNTSTSNQGRVSISNASSLGSGEYLAIAHDGGTVSPTTSTSANTLSRWTRIYRADETGNVGTVTLEFDISGAFLQAPTNPNEYVILLETIDGDFTNGGTSIISANRTVNLGAGTVTFTGVDLPDGAYFTLAEAVGDITSDQDGDWDNPSTWDCGCIPELTNDVTIEDNITINGTAANAKSITLNNGSITFSTADTLNIEEEFTIGSGTTIISGTGTIAAIGSTFAQNFTNNTTNTIALNNLYVNNTAGGLSLVNNDWSIESNLQVSAGGLDVSGAGDVTLLSSVSKTSQILPSINNAFTGNFIVERHISARNANFSNMSSPIQSATIEDINGELVLSGFGSSGNADGDALYTNSGPKFYSVWIWDGSIQEHDSVHNLSDAMNQGVGYEVWLADDNSVFNGATVTFTGVPEVGNLSVKDPDIYQGWNLVGNPYHAFINYDNLDHTGLATTFYIYNSSNGSYSSFSQGNNVAIAPAQGFWVDKTVAGVSSFIFEETDKVSGTTSNFVRKSADKELSFFLRNNNVNLGQEFKLKLDSRATEARDFMDARFLESPVKDVPQFYSTANNSSDKLAVNAIDDFSETHLIPLHVEVKKDGQFTFEAQDIDALYNSYNCVYLKDKQKDQLIDLSVDTEYEFSQTKNDPSNRFDLIISNSYEACIKPEESASINQELENNFNLRNTQGQWFLDYTIENNSSDQILIELFNTNGQKVVEDFSTVVNQSGSLVLNHIEHLNGIFVIKVSSNSDILTKTVKL